MKVLRYGLAAVAAAAMLTLTACAPAEPVLPPSIAQPPGSSQTPVTPSTAPSSSPTATGPVEPSTSVLPSSGVQSNGLPQFPVLEEQVLVYTGVKAESPTVVPRQDNVVTPVEKVTEAGGVAPTGDYVLNLTYKLCITTQMYRDQGLDLNAALTKAAAEIPGWVGFTSSEDIALATAYMDIAMTSYAYVCVPLADERARADLENGVYQG